MDILEQTKPNKNKWISFLADGILSGLMLGVGGMVSLSSENRFLGAFLFSLGLFCIVQFKYGLFTGKVGYIVNRDLPYVAETAVTLVGNALGTLIAALLLRQVRFFTSTVSTMDVTISDRVQATVSGKIHDNPLSIFILAIFCGILMFTAVEGSRKCKEERTLLVRCSSLSCRLWSLLSADSTTALRICSIISLLVVQSRPRQLFTSFSPLPETVSAV